MRPPARLGNCPPAILSEAGYLFVNPPGTPPPTAASRRVVPDTRLRDTLIAVGAGLAVLAFVAWAVVSLSSTPGVEGVIVKKEFTAAPETQVTVGQGGVTSREIAGEYVLEVRVPQEKGKTYRVYVNAADYRSHQEGERYYFIRPPPAMDAAPSRGGTARQK